MFHDQSCRFSIQIIISTSNILQYIAIIAQYIDISTSHIVLYCGRKYCNIAIFQYIVASLEYSYKLDRKNYFNLWCELGRLLLRQSHFISVFLKILKVTTWSVF